MLVRIEKKLDQVRNVCVSSLEGEGVVWADSAMIAVWKLTMGREMQVKKVGCSLHFEMRETSAERLATDEVGYRQIHIGYLYCSPRDRHRKVHQLLHAYTKLVQMYL